ncbi:hypothetical protein [Rubrivivax sp. JA1026]|uniref:hypothetical protein n=1 Tax=Rubrivivax sp. JA1026 TaxID=2710888 RepID=UPI0013E95879|nr:hypothetical protein [Rubrivivax sp. JA1026]
MTATPARRRRIIEDQIKPREFIAARYADARELIVDYISGDIDEKDLIQAADGLRNGSYESTFVAQDKNLSADAVEDFLDVSDQLPSGYSFQKVPASDRSALEISGVTISVRPDAYIKNDANEVVGAIKLHFPKTNPLSTASAEYVATGMRVFLQQNSSGSIDPRLCLVVDVPSENVIPAPKAGKKRMNDIEAACEEIRAQWNARAG